jgi:hypothetical protein
MPAYNFQRQFVPMILDLSKPHTIRRKRERRPTVPGDVLSLYTGMRTKQCKLIATSPCTHVEPLLILPLEKRVLRTVSPTVDEWLSKDGIMRLAVRDGFGNRDANNYDAVDKFFNFFLQTYKDAYLDNFELIWWDTSNLINHWEASNGA